MGNRVYLYLRTADGRPRSFAEAKNHFPLLWQLLLANASAGESIADQRVFGDDGSPNLVADTKPALHRLRRVATFIAQHPRLASRPELPHHFDATVAYAEEELAALEGSGPPQWSADMQELAWISGLDWSMNEDECDTLIGDSSGAATADFIAQCNALWEAVDAAITANDVTAFDEALELQGRAFADWTYWAWQFGFGGLDHPYFSFQEQPRLCRWEDYQPEPRYTDDALGGGLYRFTEADRVGIRSYICREDVEEEVIVRVPAEWDGIEVAQHEGELLLWVKRDGCWGLLHLPDDRPPALRRAPDLSDTGLFAKVAGQSLAIVCSEEGVGILRADGHWLLAPKAAEPVIDELWEFENGYALARSEARFGFIDAQGQWCVEPRFDDATHATAAGLAVVTLDGRQQLVSMTSEWMSPAWDQIELLIAEEQDAFQVHAGGQVGWLRADGSPWIEAEWAALDVLSVDALIRCVRDNRHGLLDWEGNVTVTPRFELIEPLPNNWSDLPLLLARNGGRIGVVSTDGTEPIPADYDRVSGADSLIAHAQDPDVPRVVLLARQQGGRRLQGAWDLERACEVIACEFDLVHPLMLYTGDDGNKEFGYLVGLLNRVEQHAALGTYRVGLRHRDGSELHPTSHAWIAKNWEPHAAGLHMIGHALATGWSRNDAVCAVANRCYVWLLRDGGRHAHTEWLAHRHHCGDEGAALRLARNLRDGEGVDTDPVQARIWFARAAGLPESAIPKHVRGPLARLLRRDRHDFMPVASDASRSVDPDALYELAVMLHEGTGDRPNLPAARALLEHLLEYGKPNHRAGLVLLGQILRDIGSQQDVLRSVKLFARAERMQCANGAYELAHAYHHGLGVATDLDAAVRHYREAGKRSHLNGYIDGAFALVTLIARMKRSRQREHHARELSRLLRLAIAESDPGRVGQAYTLLGRCQAQGLGCEVDLDAAESSWLAGVDAGEVEVCAQELADLYARNDESWNDPEREAYWRRRARFPNKE